MFLLRASISRQPFPQVSKFGKLALRYLSCETGFNRRIVALEPNSKLLLPFGFVSVRQTVELLAGFGHRGVGVYTLKTWHEDAGLKSLEITVPETGDIRVGFEFTNR